MNLKVGDPGTGAEWTIGSVNAVKWSFRGDLGQTVMIRLQRLGWVNAQMTLAEVHLSAQAAQELINGKSLLICRRVEIIR